MPTGIYKRTEYHRKILRKSIKKLQEWVKKNGPWNKDKKMSEEFRLKAKLSHLGIKPTEETKEKMALAQTGKKHSDEHNRKVGLANTGSKHWNWQDGKSFEPYSIEFNSLLKNQVRQRDQYRCQECFRHQDELRTKTNKPYKLSIHHIDYNKQNNNQNNLISLCGSCHTQTNYGRNEWQKYFHNKLINK